MRKLISTFCLIAAVSLSGCGADAESSGIGLPGEDSGQASLIQDETSPSETSAQESTEADEPAEMTDITLVCSDLNKDVSFNPGKCPKELNYINSYTEEPRYSFRIDEAKCILTQESDFHQDFQVTISGEKTYDWLGDDQPRHLSLTMRVADSGGNIVDSFELYSSGSVVTGQKFEDLAMEFRYEQRLILDPGDYTISFDMSNSYTYDKVPAGTEGYDPERWYVVAFESNTDDENDTLPIEKHTQWIRDCWKKDFYIDDDLILHGVFDEPFDLHNADHTESAPAPEPDSLSPDTQYGPVYYYDIYDPGKYPSDFPEDAVPSNMRIAYFPGGDLFMGERPFVMVVMHYDSTDDFSGGYLRLCTIQGKTIGADEWEKLFPYINQ